MTKLFYHKNCKKVINKYFEIMSVYNKEALSQNIWQKNIRMLKEPELFGPKKAKLFNGDQAKL